MTNPINGHARYELQRADANDEDVKRAILALMARAQQDRTLSLFRDEAAQVGLVKWREEEARRLDRMWRTVDGIATALWCLTFVAVLGAALLLGQALYRAVVL